MALRDKDWALTLNQDVLGSVTNDTTAVTYDVSGFYEQNGTANGRTKWTHETDTDLNISWDGVDTWEIFDGVTLVFDAAEDVATPDLVTTWSPQIPAPRTVNTAGSVTANWGLPIKIQNAVRNSATVGTETITVNNAVKKRTIDEAEYEFLSLTKSAADDIATQLALSQYQEPGDTARIVETSRELQSYNVVFNTRTLGTWSDV